ncbi:MAG: type VI secretion system lipoprotein TssJ [Polyangiaceae bacterium]|nr:type VI secretion system lipoprotein TssJ [Polyangiaceae bacterium]
MRTVLLTALVGALAACSSASPPPAKSPPKRCPPPQTELSISATARVNPSTEGEGRPVIVRVYQLVSDARLRNATFEEMWQKDKEILATDLKGVSEHTIFPGKTETVSIKRSRDAHVVALVALFREPQGNDWFVTYELPTPPTTPPCASAKPIPVILDRMQIQDGEGRAVEEQVAEPKPDESAPTENQTNADEGD